MAQQELSFASDIRPLFRDRDIQSMQSAFDLASYDDVRANADAIYAGARRRRDAMRRRLARGRRPALPGPGSTRARSPRGRRG